MWASLCALSVVALPAVDPVAGAELTPAERAVLPSGRHLAQLADMWLVDSIALTLTSGPLAILDPVATSAHGRSWTQTRYLLNGLDLTDPAASGRPLFELPDAAWDTIRHESLWSPTPGFSSRFAARTGRAGLTLRGDGGASVGGGSWMPPGFDREPALRFGASTVQREAPLSAAGSAEGRFDLGGAAVRLFVEERRLHLTYPTLLDADDGRSIVDRGLRRTTLLAAAAPIAGWEVELTAGYQKTARDHAGAEARLPAALTLGRDDQVGLVQLAARRGGARYAVGLAGGQESLVSRRDGPIVTDLEGEWAYMARPGWAGDRQRWRWDLRAEPGAWSVAGGELRPRLDGRLSMLSDERAPTGGVLGTTYDRGVERGLDRGATLTVVDPGAAVDEWWSEARVGAEWTGTLAQTPWIVYAAADHAAVGYDAQVAWGQMAPALGVVARPFAGPLTVLLRSEPDAPTSELAAFVNRDRPSRRQYGWQDDGDGRIEPGETGRLLSRGGGNTHVLDDGLTRPRSHQLALAYTPPSFGAFEAVLSGAARLHVGRLETRLVGPAAASFAPTEVDDPQGGGRLGAWARTPGTEGEEVYALRNADDVGYWVGAEVQLRTDRRPRPWFLSLALSGYWNVAETPFGIFADRNDPGIIDEASAFPNAKVNAHGRPDADRSFGINLLVGVEPLPGLTLAGVLRYRDGEPFARLLVADLPQGSTLLLAEARGDPIPRFTFHMQLDVRLRYAFVLGDWAMAASLDAFNLLGSGTEILEDIRSGADFRRSYEMMPGRTLVAGLEVSIGQ